MFPAAVRVRHKKRATAPLELAPEDESTAVG
jgi:hypothetical protein